LLELPSHTVVLLSEDEQLLHHWAAFFSAAVLFGANWGVRHGAIRATTVPIHAPGATGDVDVIAAFERLVLIRTERGPLSLEQLARRLTSLPSAPCYPMDWAAAAYALTLLEDA
jgi:hypothetical protein